MELTKSLEVLMQNILENFKHLNTNSKMLLSPVAYTLTKIDTLGTGA